MLRPPVVRGFTIAALFAASLAPMLGASGSAAAAEGVVAEALEPGSWSVQFSVQPNLTLGSYSGSTLSLKRHLASGNAIRFGVSLDIGGGGEDFVDAQGDTFNSIGRSLVEDRRHQAVGVGATYLWYTQRAAPVHGYWGGGPAASWSRSHTLRNQTQTYSSGGQPPQTNVLVEDYTSRFWRVGVAGTAGVEWLVARRVGVFAEYGTALNYTSSRSTRRATVTSSGQPTRTDTFDRDAHAWDFSGSGGRLGVSVYY